MAGRPSKYKKEYTEQAYKISATQKNIKMNQPII
jgi:hypothetical protein